jgi:hypothetical protein
VRRAGVFLERKLMDMLSTAEEDISFSPFDPVWDTILDERFTFLGKA